MLKLVEVLFLVCAGALFVWWQFRDLRQAREHSLRQREALRTIEQEKVQSGSDSSAGPTGGRHEL